eukprot:scaffold301_cov370-Pavlova_lutheri.AAC.28
MIKARAYLLDLVPCSEWISSQREGVHAQPTFTSVGKVALGVASYGMSQSLSKSLIANTSTQVEFKPESTRSYEKDTSTYFPISCSFALVQSAFEPNMFDPLIWKPNIMAQASQNYYVLHCLLLQDHKAKHATGDYAYNRIISILFEIRYLEVE